MQISWKLKYKNNDDLIRQVLEGNISLETNHGWFPEENWEDFVILILLSWLENAHELISDERENLPIIPTEIRNYFGEGPFFFSLVPDSNVLHIHFYRKDEAEDREILPPETMSSSQYCKLLTKAAAEIIEEAHRLGIDSITDIQALADTSQSLQVKMNPKISFE